MTVIPLVAQIDALLPQTQCGQCGHQGCRPYAEALAAGHEPINRCPPGGEEGIAALAALLNVPALPFAPDAPQPKPRALAFIREDSCIGCTLCIQACPVDAIVGAAKYMHTVIAEDCSGCELCIAPCPVDCIDLVPVADANDGERSQLLMRAAQYRRRFDARNDRHSRLETEKAQRLADRAAQLAQPKPAAPVASAPVDATTADKAALIRAAMERAAAKLPAAPAPAKAEAAPMAEDEKAALIRAAMERAAARRAAKDNK